METAAHTAHTAQQTLLLRREPAAGSPGHDAGDQTPWSNELLSQFGLCMASHGMSISSTQMRVSPRYAMQQLAHARAINDDRLQLLATQMFQLFESHRSGVPRASH